MWWPGAPGWGLSLRFATFPPQFGTRPRIALPSTVRWGCPHTSSSAERGTPSPVPLCPWSPPRRAGMLHELTPRASRRRPTSASPLREGSDTVARKIYLALFTHFFLQHFIPQSSFQASSAPLRPPSRDAPGPVSRRDIP